MVRGQEVSGARGVRTLPEQVWPKPGRLNGDLVPGAKPLCFSVLIHHGVIQKAGPREMPAATMDLVCHRSLRSMATCESSSCLWTRVQIRMCVVRAVIRSRRSRSRQARLMQPHSLINGCSVVGQERIRLQCLQGPPGNTKVKYVGRDSKTALRA
jgi:hypothetical protein